MGCVTATAKRRRKQAVSGYRNMRPNDRPYYKLPTEALRRRREVQKAANRASRNGRKSRGAF